MNRQNLTLPVLLVALASAPLLAAAPPARPLPLTPSQFEALQQIEQAPEHMAVRQVHATYQSEREHQMEVTRTVDDATSAATFAGWIGAIATILILAAPL